MKTTLKAIIISAILGFATSAFAIPTLQVGAPGGAGEGAYADYIVSSGSPTESDSAFTSGNTILVGGAYGPNDLLIGGNTLGGNDWSTFGFDASFNPMGAVLMASVSNGSNALTINGFSSFYTTTSNLFPNNHAPLGVASSFMFFNIGDFAMIPGAVTNFVDETGSATGEVKSLTLGGTSGYDWIHFDVMALVTDLNKKAGLYTNLDNNPGSHDLTWKKSSNNVPEPSTSLLLSLGLMGLLLVRRERATY